jgi:hypothetical protein
MRHAYNAVIAATTTPTEQAMELISVLTIPMPLHKEKLAGFNKPFYPMMVREVADTLHTAVSENKDISDVSFCHFDVSFCYFYDTIKSMNEPNIILSETLSIADGDSDSENFNKFKSAWNHAKNLPGFNGGYLATWRRGYLTILHFAKE